MQVQLLGDFSVIPDNEENYLNLISAVIDSVDELSSLEVKRLPNAYSFRIAPSTPQYCNSLLEEILKLNNKLHIHLDLSKSIKSSGGTISFEIILK